MKTRGLMLIAILFSGAAFAQNATVKTEQTASVKVKSQTGNEGPTAKGNVTVKSAVMAENEAAGLLENTASEVKGTADEHINTTIETGKQSTVHAAQGIKNTLNTSAGISGNLLKTTNLKVAPVKINTRIISTTGLFIR